MGELVEEKSELHRRLEESLATNKALVLRLVARRWKNPLEIESLREQATELTKQLTSEIQREVQEKEDETKNKTNTLFFAANTSVGRVTNRISFILSNAQQNGSANHVEGEMKLMLLLFSVSLPILVVLWWKAIVGPVTLLLFLLYVFFTLYLASLQGNWLKMRS